MSSDWVKKCQEYRAKHGCSYKEAMVKCSSGKSKPKAVKPKVVKGKGKKGVTAKTKPVVDQTVVPTQDEATDVLPPVVTEPIVVKKPRKKRVTK